MSDSSESPAEIPADKVEASLVRELEWKRAASECPICGWEMTLVNGFHRCKNCGYKEPCCWN